MLDCNINIKRMQIAYNEALKANNEDEVPIGAVIFKNDKIKGFICQSGKEVVCSQLILTTGTFLNGLIHIGEKQIPAGRYDE